MPLLLSTRCTRVRNLLVACLIAIVAVTIAMPGSASGRGAITISGQFETGETLIDSTGYELGGIALDPEGESIIFDLNWTRNEQSWIPYWAIRLRDDQRLLGDAQVIELARVTPALDHTFDWALSFDPSAASLSMQVYDVTDGQLVYAGGFSFPPLTDPTFPVTGTGGTVIGEQYTPYGTAWEFGIVGPENEFFLSDRFEPTDDATVRLTVPGALPGGKYRVLLEPEDPSTPPVALGPFVPKQSETFIPLPDLPLGSVQATLEYFEDGVAVLRRVQEFSIGNLAVDFGFQVRQLDLGFAGGDVTLYSGTPLSDVELSVFANFAELVWDEERREFHTVPYGEPMLVMSDTVDIPAGETTLSIRTPLPAKGAVWEMELDVVAQPDVVSSACNTTHYVTSYLPAEIGPDEPFRVIVLPDTQYLAKTYPHVFMRIGEWVAANAADMNIAFALHMGDVTNENTHAQWRRASDSMKLWHGIVPYVLSVGNHDYPTDGRSGGQVYARGTSKINEYFQADDFPHLAGMFEDGRLENAYYTLEVGGTRFLIISLEFGAPDEALTWANEVAAAYPDHFGILTTHTYTRRDGTRNYRGYIANLYEIANNPETTVNDGEDMWWKFVRNHANMGLVLSGHLYSPVIPYNLGRGAHGNLVHEMLINYQSEDFGGNGYIAILEFRPDGELKVDAYSPFLDAYKTDAFPLGFSNSFTVNVTTDFARQ